MTNALPMRHAVHDTSESRPLDCESILRDVPDGAPVGLIAGWGRFPICVAEKLKALGHPVHCVAITGHAGDELNDICESVLWSGVGRFGGHLRYFKRNDVAHVTMAGKLFKSDLLYSGSVWIRHTPDWTCIKTFWPCLFGARRDARDDRLLGAVIDTYENHAMKICSATDLAPELLAKTGQLTRRKPSSVIQSDISAGWQIAKTMGGLDIGQAITIKDGTIIAVEAPTRASHELANFVVAVVGHWSKSANQIKTCGSTCQRSGHKRFNAFMKRAELRSQSKPTKRSCSTAKKPSNLPTDSGSLW